MKKRIENKAGKNSIILRLFTKKPFPESEQNTIAFNRYLVSLILFLCLTIYLSKIDLGFDQH
jgi:hypothetical protein